MASGVELATAWVRLVPTVEGIQESISKEIGDANVDGASEEVGKRAGSGIGAGLKVGLAAAAGLAIAGVAKVFQTGMEEIKFGEQISAQTDQLIANTGAGFSTKWVEDYTLALSQVSGIAEEDLQSAGNNVLRFGDVSEDTYQRAVASINDMGGAGKDVAGVSEALGKALADPAAAAALLKRQGVLLNEEQQALIDNFTATGDKAAAQGVILDALEGTYGGMAEAAGGTTQGAISKLGNTFENLSATIVTAVMPAVSGILVGLTGFFAWIEQNQWVLPVIATAIGVTLVAAFIAWTASIWAATVALLANPITWIILAIVALIAAVVLLVMNWDTVVKFITNIWAGFISWITGVIRGFVGWWNGIWAAVGAWIKSVWDGIVSGVTALFTRLYVGLMGVGRSISGWWNGLWSGISSFFSGVWSGILGVVNSIGGAFGAAFSTVAGIVRGAFNSVVGVIRGVVNNIIGLVNGVIRGINSVAGAVGAAIGVSISIPTIPGLWQGGTITSPGTVLVGERGPELVHLPRGASVDPDISRPSSGGGLRDGDALTLVVDGQTFRGYVRKQAAGVTGEVVAPSAGGRR